MAPSPTQPVSYHRQKGRPMYCPLETQLAPESVFISDERIFGPLYLSNEPKSEESVTAVKTLQGHHLIFAEHRKNFLRAGERFKRDVAHLR